MRYIGSKSATLPWISQVVAERGGDAVSMCDPFAGTCTVARHFKNTGMTVVTGDLMRMSHVLQVATLFHDVPPQFKGLRPDVIRNSTASPVLDVILHLQNLPPMQGYITKEFSLRGPGARLFFSDENAQRIDAIRTEIHSWHANGLLSDSEESYLKAILILAADRVANTAGTYYAHLKSLSRKALLPLQLAPPPTTTKGSSGGCYNAAALDVVKATTTDILYLDPPYNSRDYGSYYHLPETLARGDSPTARGKSGVPAPRSVRSPFYRKSEAGNALSQICAAARARHILVHYTTEGTIPHDRILEALRERGDVHFEDQAVRAYSASRSPSAREAWHRIYWCDVRTENKIDASSKY